MKGHHWAFYLLIWLVWAGVLSGCDGQDVGVDEDTFDSELGPHLLIATSGEVFLKRNGWTRYAPTSWGVEIQRGDLIRPAEGKTVTILCANLELYRLERESGNPCQVERYILHHTTTPRSAPRGSTSEIPYIRHPRHTKLWHTQPTLRWHDSGASGYTVAIIEGGQTIWQQTGVQGTELLYPDDAPPFRSGVHYLLSITDEDSGERSIEEPIKGLGFQVLTDEEREEIKAQRDKILALPLEEAAHHIALATYYAGQELRGEALAELEQIDPASLSPAIHRKLGDLLLAVRLPNEAETAYQTALNSAPALGDLETQAAAHFELWNLTEDEQQLQSAIELYEQLGDETMVDTLRAELP